jgi:hypothetical protein
MPKPGHVEQQQKSHTKSEDTTSRRTSTSRHTITEEEAKQLDEECMQRFIKVNSKIITRSKGAYDGILIITPSAVMFDPLDSNAPSNPIKDDTYSARALTANSNNSSKNGTQSETIYDEASAIIPIEIISNVILYEDLSLKEVKEYFDYQQTQEYKFLYMCYYNSYLQCDVYTSHPI